MGGKVTGAVAAIAVSSASASVVGVVYKGFESFRSDPPGVYGLVEVAERAPSEKGFVVDTTNDHVTSLPDVPAESGPRCQDDSGSGRCIVVLPLRELELNFLGHTVTLPTDWYSSDEGDDLYGVREEGRFLGKLFDLQQTVKSHVLASDQDTVQNSSEDNNNSYVEVEPQTFNLGDVSPEQDLTLIAYTIVVGDLGTSEPQSSSIPSGPSLLNGVTSYIPSASPALVPEPSTWAMLLAGFAGLGFLGCRRTRASGPPQRRRAT